MSLPRQVQMLACIALYGSVALAAPGISSISPASVAAGSPDFVLTVNGSGFVSGSLVQWNGASLPTTFVSSSQVTATVAASRVAVWGAAAIRVWSPGDLLSASVFLTVTGGPPASNYYSMYPATAIAGGSGFVLTVSGVGFAYGDIIQFNGQNLATNFLSSIQMTAFVPASAIAAAGSYTVLIVTGGRGLGPLTFIVTASGPAITQLSPATAVQGSGELTMTVNGSYFIPGSIVEWNGLTLSTTFVSSTQLRASVPALRLATAGAASITVSNQTGPRSNAMTFTVTAGAGVTQVSPNSIPAGSADFTLTVTGSGFVAGSLVQWNNLTLGTSFVSSTQLRALVPASMVTFPGALISVAVWSPPGIVTNSLPFTVTAALPTLSLLTPASAVAGSAAFTLFLNGAGFGPDSSVRWNGQTLPTFYMNNTQLNAQVPAGALASAGTATVAVFNASSGLSNSLIFAVTDQRLTITSVGPASVPAGGLDFFLSIGGVGFTNLSAVQWNGVALATTYVSSTLLTAAVPARLITAAGDFPVKVVNPGGTASNMFTVTVTPALNSIAPAQTIAGTAGTVTLTGLGFTADCRVEVSGFGRVSTTYLGPTVLTAVIPPASLGPPGNRASVFVTCTSASNSLLLESKGPSITAISPSAVAAGGSDVVLTIDGTFFAPGALVGWNGNPPSLQAQYVSATRLTVAIPAALLANAAANTITVYNVGGWASNSAPFVVGAAQLAATSVTPNTLIATGPPSLITVRGTGFTREAVVEMNGEALSTSYVSGTELIAGVLARMVATPGVRLVTVRVGAGVSNSATVSVSGAPYTTLAWITNLAGGPAIAPGSLIAIYGYNLAGDAALPPDGIPQRTLNGTTVRIQGVSAPLLYVSPGQVNAQVPYEAPLGVVYVEFQVGAEFAKFNTILSATGPGVWHVPNSGQVLGINTADGSLNAPDHPIQPGQFLTVYLTGQGQVTNPVATGAAAPASPFSLPVAPVTATLGGIAAKVAFAGLAPGLVGLMQMNLEIPDVPAGQQRLDITIGDLPANPVFVWVAERR